MRIAINKIHFPVTTLGFGRRVGIWVQGCSIHCRGCLSRDTWSFDEKSEITINDLVGSCMPWFAEADGVTISGGEPFDQAPAVAALIRSIRSCCAGDILIYSGYSLERLMEHHQPILTTVDVVISDPYVADTGNNLALRGSDNQRVRLLTDLARERYPAQLDVTHWSDERRLDVLVSNGEVWMAGIPRRGDLARLRGELTRRGFTTQTSDQPTIRA